MPPVVCNTPPLVALWALEQLPLLRDLFGDILIPPTVAAEFLAAETAARRAALTQAPWIAIQPLARPTEALAYAQLDQGEAEVLALALETNARLVIIDEATARQYARRLRLPLAGTLGVLLLAKENHLLPALRPEIERLLAAGLHLKPDLVAAVLKQASES